ncbi:MAG: cytochrome P450 [Myxococcales bacterium]|nr:cytochrome P450 [Myxococcales bacterium]MCB9713520.1 cytochrome P450 [Myxococcales bacterium]
MSISSTMRELGIDKDNYRTLGLLPLVFVAWADGTVQRAEEALIRRVARDKGWLEGSGEALLEGWLEQPPEALYVEKGLALIKQLAAERQGIAGSITAETLNSLLVLCKEVAEAAGGMWGLTESICDEEESALATIAEAFGIGDAKTWRRIVSDLESAPVRSVPGPRGHILVGELPAVTRDPLGLFMRCLDQYGDVVRLRMPGLDWYLVSHPDHVKHVLVDHSRNYVRGRSYERFRLLVDESIATTDGERWRPLRRIAQPAFHRDSVASMGEMMVRCTTEMVDRWQRRPRPEDPLDVASELSNLTLRIIGHALFSIDLQDQRTAEISDAVGIALEYMAGSTNPFRLPSSVPTRTNRRFAQALKRFESFVLAALAERAESEERSHDLMSMILDAIDPETGEGLSHAQIRNEMLSYLVAGHETSATTLTWMLYLLSKHPIVGRRLLEEIERELGGRLPTVESIEQLTYLDQVIQETMRLYPAAFMLPREVVSEDRLGGYTIPAKSWVLVAPYVTHRRPDFWPNPEGFDPERFTPEASMGRHPCAYYPFFAGPHKCIGRPLSLMEMKLIVATLLPRCRLDLRPGFEPEVDAQVTLRSRNGLMVQPRWHG